jgi:hypothetical protein
MKSKPKKGGRKPVDDKKVVVTIYIRQSQIDELGGKSAVQSIATQHIEGLKKGNT